MDEKYEPGEGGELAQIDNLEIEPLSDSDLESAAGGLAAGTNTCTTYTCTTYTCPTYTCPHLEQ